MRIVALIAALSLAACAAVQPTGPADQPTLPAAQQAVANVANVLASGVSALPPQPLAGTTLDDSAVRAGYQALDTAATIIDALVASKTIVPGSPRALAIRKALTDTRLALDAAAAAQRAGQAQSYRDLLVQAETAAANIEAFLGSSS